MQCIDLAFHGIWKWRNTISVNCINSIIQSLGYLHCSVCSSNNNNITELDLTASRVIYCVGNVMHLHMWSNPTPHPSLHHMLCCSSQYGDMLHDTERVSPGLQRRKVLCVGMHHTERENMCCSCALADQF